MLILERITAVSRGQELETKTGNTGLGRQEKMEEVLVEMGAEVKKEEVELEGAEEPLTTMAGWRMKNLSPKGIWSAWVTTGTSHVGTSLAL